MARVIVGVAILCLADIVAYSALVMKAEHRTARRKIIKRACSTIRHGATMAKSLEQKPERFELIGQQGDLSGNLRLRYGSGPHDPQSFVVTLTSQYVARSLKDGQPNMPTTMPGSSGPRPYSAMNSGSAHWFWTNARAWRPGHGANI
jgi:hypothetical protein